MQIPKTQAEAKKLLDSGEITQADYEWCLQNLPASQDSSINVGGNAERNVLNTGRIEALYQVFINTEGATLTKDAFSKMLQEYLELVSREYVDIGLLTVKSMANTGGNPEEKLGEIFIPPTLQRFQPLDERKLHAKISDADDPFALDKAAIKEVDIQKHQRNQTVALEELLTQQDKLAIIGGAGSGKTTLLHWLAYTLAQANLGRVLPTPELQLDDLSAPPIPIVIPLRNYRVYVQACDAGLRVPHGGKSIFDFITWWLERQNDIGSASATFLKRLLKGGGCLLLLDGLDEVVDRRSRADVKKQVERLTKVQYPNNKVIVTAREAGYVGRAIFSDKFLRLDVRPLETQQIEALVANWYNRLKLKLSQSALLDGIARINAQHPQRPLISSPLMVTMVISVVWGKATLPKDRAKLYEACVEVILQSLHDYDDARADVEAWGTDWDWEKQREWLSAIAYTMHTGGENSASISEDRLREICRSLDVEPKPTTENIDAFIIATKERGGLFQERGGLLMFLHLTFQEFLTARKIAKDRDFNLIEAHVSDAWWREVVLLTYGFSKADHTPTAKRYLDWLIATPTGEPRNLRKLELAGTALLELEHTAADAHSRVADELIYSFENKTLKAPATLRAQVGTVLSALGDPRFNPNLAYLPTGPQLGLVEIPAGTFKMGSNKADDAAAWDDEMPQHNRYVDTYYLAKYPVTVRQWQAYHAHCNSQPKRERSLQGSNSAPVVYIDWHEANAYCQWLNTWLPTQTDVSPWLREKLSSGWQITLPTESQWEKAARGMQDARIFPWGNKIDKDRLNYGESGIGGRSVVGVFIATDLPWDVRDMVGNVWEWTQTSWQTSYETYDPALDKADSNRVLRGGAFNYDHRFVRCASRPNHPPDDGTALSGFGSRSPQRGSASGLC